MTRGALSLVLHTHMPYVEGYGTWPFGEEWLWEAVATCYLPLLDLLDAHPGTVTLSVTPVLADQLEAPGALERCLRFLREIRPESHRRDIAVAGSAATAAALEHSAAVYATAADRLAGTDVAGRLLAHADWTSAATHAVLPLLASSAGVRLQLETGIAAHRARHGSWNGGLWLPECAHAPWLDELLEQAGVHAVCVDLTDVLGRGAPAQLVPLRSPAGPLLVPIDRAQLELVWSDAGYPARGAYRDTHRMTAHRHAAWAVDGSPYDPARAVAQARADAEDFVARAVARVRDGGLCVVAFDTELLGHHWHEGVTWLAAVLTAARAAELPVVPLDVALGAAAPAPGSPAVRFDRAAAGLEPVPAPALPVSSWGTPRDLRTWSAPAAGGLAWRQRAAELRVAARAPDVSERALRELLALQSSDWAFLASRASAGSYPVERAAGHAAALDAALRAQDAAAPGPRNLAPRPARWSVG